MPSMGIYYKIQQFVFLAAFGINNAMIKVTLIIDLGQKMIVPYDIKKKNAQYKLELGSKLINGTVPSIYGGSLFQKSATIEN